MSHKVGPTGRRKGLPPVAAAAQLAELGQKMAEEACRGTSAGDISSTDEEIHRDCFPNVCSVQYIERAPAGASIDKPSTPEYTTGVCVERWYGKRNLKPTVRIAEESAQRK
jgi:hypothetical protein